MDKEKLLAWLEESKKASREQIKSSKDSITFHFTSGEENAFGLVEMAIRAGKFDKEVTP